VCGATTLGNARTSRVDRLCRQRAGASDAVRMQAGAPSDTGAPQGIELELDRARPMVGDGMARGPRMR
jgi:hypothetical protein